jgi:hypothetical protein
MVTIERRGPHYVLPLLLIVAGVIALLANVGLIADGFWDRLFQLWPVILVVVGIELLTRGAGTRTAVRLGAFALVVVVAAAATLYVVGPWLPATGLQNGTSSAPIGGLASGSLHLSVGAGTVTLTSANLGEDLYSASYSSSGIAPSRSFEVNGSTLSIKVGNRNAVPWVRQGDDRLDLTLNQSIPWSVTIDAGGVNGTLDLRAADLRSLTVNSAAGNLTVELAAPANAVPISFNGVAQNLIVSVPAGTPVRVHAAGIAGSVVLPDGRALNAALGDRSWQSTGYPGDAGSYSIEVSGVASKLALEVPQS